MHVALGHAEFAVPSEFLDGSRWRPAHRQMRAERVPQHVNTFSELRPFSRSFNAILHLLPREGPTVLPAHDERTSQVAMVLKSWLSRGVLGK